MLLKTGGSRRRCPESFPDTSTAPSQSSRRMLSPSAAQNMRRAAKGQRELHHTTMDAVEVCILGSDCRGVAGTVLDVSQRELRIGVDAPIVRGTRIDVVLHRRVTISGLIRFCRRSQVGYQIGLLIESIYYAQSTSADHPHDDQLSLYLAGKGLTTMEIIHTRDHLAACRSCIKRLIETAAISGQMRRPYLAKTTASFHA